MYPPGIKHGNGKSPHKTEVSSWEIHGTKWGIFQQAMFDYRRVINNDQYTLWLFNIAMENGPFIEGLPIKIGDFPWLC